MKYLFIILIALTACKKKTVEPIIETVLIEVYNTNHNATLKVFEATEVITATNFSNTYNVSENDLKFSITLKNNFKTANDSINLKVTYKGVTQQKGIKCVNVFGSIYFTL